MVKFLCFTSKSLVQWSRISFLGTCPRKFPIYEKMELELLCRICLGNSSNCSNIFLMQSSDENPLYQIINYVYDLEITLDDGLPEHVCVECFEIIKGFENYKRNAHKAKSKLISMKEKNNVFIKVEKEDYEEIPEVHVEQFHEPEVMIETKVDVRKDAASPSWSQDAYFGGRNYMGHQMSNYSTKEDSEEVGNEAEDQRVVITGGLNEDKVVDEGGENDVYAKDGEEMESEADGCCNYCGERKGTLDDLKEHIFRVHMSVLEEKGKGDDGGESEGKRHKCMYCEKVYKSKESLVRHVKGHTGEEPLKCDLCDYKTHDRWHLMKHNLTHAERKPFQCELCDYSCVQRSDLKIHMCKHTGMKPFKCEFCDYSCSKSCDFKAHVRIHTGEKPYKCQYCDYCCSKSRQLLTHTQRHTGELPYKCEFCDYRCSNSSKLKLHTRKHTGERPYKCDFCDYTCSDSSKLKLHTRKHTGEKPYKCEYCDCSFTQGNNLQLHVRTHTGERPYKCEHCERSFTTSGQLKVHTRKHTGEKPFQCEFCDYRCSQSSDLRRHSLRHAEEKPFKCQMCEYSCSRNAQLVAHTRKHERGSLMNVNTVESA